MILKTKMRPNGATQGLIDLCSELKKKIGDNITFVEVGSYTGESAIIFAKNLPNSKIYCVDPWVGNFDDRDTCSHANYKDVEEEFDLRIKDINNIIKIKNYSTSVKIECDVVYIDGRHFYEGVKEDILHWLPLTKSVICGHDFLKTPSKNNHVNGVQQAVREIFGEPDKIFSDTSWLVWKK